MNVFVGSSSSFTYPVDTKSSFYHDSLLFEFLKGRVFEYKFFSKEI